MSIAVIYHNTKYRIHAAGCRDVKREPGLGWGLATYDDGTTVEKIAAKEFSDFIAEDPEYYTPDVVLDEFLANATILPCAEAHLGREAVAESDYASA